MERGWEEWEAFSGPKNKSEQKFINNLYKKDLVKILPYFPYSYPSDKPLSFFSQRPKGLAKGFSALKVRSSKYDDDNTINHTFEL